MTPYEQCANRIRTLVPVKATFETFLNPYEIHLEHILLALHNNNKMATVSSDSTLWSNETEKDWLSTYDLSKPFSQQEQSVYITLNELLQ